MHKIVLPLFCCLLACLAGRQVTAQQAPASPGPARMNHLAFQVKNLATSTEFYMHVIGLDSMPEPFRDGRHTWLKLGNSSHLHLIFNAESQPVVPGKQTHLCFSVPSVPLFVNTLHQRQIPYEDWPGTASQVTTRPDGVHQLYLQDPDGYWIEINDATE